MDIGVQYTDRQFLILLKKIKNIYAEAERDLADKLQDFTERFKVKEAKHLNELHRGEITQEQYDGWLRGQVFQDRQWKLKREQIANTLFNANSEATRIINGETISVFAENANVAAYMLEHGAGVNFGFGLYDSNTVTNLLKNDPNILPFKKMNKAKDKKWNFQKIRNQITQGIIQGERLDQIAKRLSTATGSQNMRQMIMHARTAMTSAQNAGRQIRYEEAEKKDIKLHKEWMATFDNHTRDAHRELDGQKVPVGKKFKVDGYEIDYPGDPHAQPYLIYNCRCTMVSDLDDFPEDYERYDNINGHPVSQMTYREWYKAKEGVTEIEAGQFTIGTAKTIEEINEFMNSQGWFRKVSDWGDGVYSQADLTGCDLDSAKSIASAYQQVFEKYPQLAGKLDAPDAHPIGMGDNTYAWCYLRSNGKVEVNPKYYSDWGSVVRHYERDIETRWHPEGTTAESIVIHELGHSIDGLLAREGVLGGYTSSGEFRGASASMKTKVMNRAAKQDESIAEYWNAKDWSGKADKYWQSYAVEKSVSRYATENAKEWFAECFAEYITSAKPRIVASEFGKELELLMEKLK